jgi:hypothetical protein
MGSANCDLISPGIKENATLAKPPINPPRKQRTREHILADLSANHVEKIALHCGFAVEQLRQDYGLDLAVFTFDEQGYRETGQIWMQLKATDLIKATHDGEAFRIRLDRRDILDWIADPYPVMLILYDAAQNRAYWLSIQSQFVGPEGFGKLRGKTVTVLIPKKSCPNGDATLAS